MTACSLYVTAGSREDAGTLARALIEARLAACANIIPGVTSVYRWQDAVQEDAECVVVFKTRQDLVPAATEKILAVHPYDCPCVVALPIQGGNPAFLDWIRSETA